MALQLNTVSFGDFLKSLMKARKAKDAKVTIGDCTYWLTDWGRIDKAARTAGILVKVTGLEVLGEGEDEESYMTFLADIDGSGDVKRLAVRL